MVVDENPESLVVGFWQTSPVLYRERDRWHDGKASNSIWLGQFEPRVLLVGRLRHAAFSRCYIASPNTIQYR